MSLVPSSLNPAATAGLGLNAGKTAAPGAAAGFEALMAAFFGAAGQATPGAVAAATAASADPSTDAESEADAALVVTDEATTGSELNLSLMALVIPPPPPLVQQVAVEAEPTVGGADAASDAATPLAGDDGLAAQATPDDLLASLGAQSLDEGKDKPLPAAPQHAAQQAQMRAAEPAAVHQPPPAAAPPAQVQDTVAAQSANLAQAAAAPADSAAVDASETTEPQPQHSAAPKDKTRSGRAEARGAASQEAPRTGGAQALPAAPVVEATDVKAPAHSEAAPVEQPEIAVDSTSDPSGPGLAPPDVHTHAAPEASQAAAAPVRGSPETVASLAANILKKLGSRTTSFDLQLDPAGLGRVDVRLEIGAHGQVTAAMTFDNPQAASELKARAAELQRTLEQAGFNLSGGMTFDVAGDGRRGAQGQAQREDLDSGAAFRGRAFQAALDTAGDAMSAAASSALYLTRSANSGVDVRI